MNLGPVDTEFPGANSFNFQAKKYIDETEDIDLGVLHPDAFLDTAFRKKTDIPVGSINYLDFVDLQEDQGYQQMVLKSFNKFFEVGTFHLEVPLKDEHLEDLKKIHDSDVDQMVKQALYEESLRIMKNHLYEKYKSLGEKSRKESLNKYQSKLETKWKIPAWIVLKNENSVGKRLAVKIQGAANSIAVTSRRGPGNFVVLNNILASIISDCPEFNFSDNGTLINSGIHQIGVLFGRISVFVNPFEKENVAIVGRTPKENDPGVYVLEYICSLRRVKYQEPFSLEIKQNTSIRNRTAFVEIGKKPESCYRLMRFVFEDKLSIWEKILNKVVKPPVL